jgi:hypothetical protein
MPHERHVKKLLNLPRRLPQEQEDRVDYRSFDISRDGAEPRYIYFRLLTPEQADDRSRYIVKNERPGRGRPRVLACCDDCGKWVSAGRFNQHYQKHEQVG